MGAEQRSVPTCVCLDLHLYHARLYSCHIHIAYPGMYAYVGGPLVWVTATAQPVLDRGRWCGSRDSIACADSIAGYIPDMGGYTQYRDVDTSDVISILPSAEHLELLSILLI